MPQDKPHSLATFAGGCFWCLQPPYDGVPGVLKVTVGYTGGKHPHPSYEAVCSGVTGHYEAVQVEFDPEKISYEKLLEIFWQNINPEQAEGQFCDIGSQYKTAVFYHDEAQHRAAEDAKRRLTESGEFSEAIATEIRPAAVFYPAEEYHQDYYLKNPMRYQMYKVGSGREAYLNSRKKSPPKK